MLLSKYSAKKLCGLTGFFENKEVLFKEHFLDGAFARLFAKGNAAGSRDCKQENI